jgi:dynein heavy chain 1
MVASAESNIRDRPEEFTKAKRRKGKIIRPLPYVVRSAGILEKIAASLNAGVGELCDSGIDPADVNEWFSQFRSRIIVTLQNFINSSIFIWILSFCKQFYSKYLTVSLLDKYQNLLAPLLSSPSSPVEPSDVVGVILKRVASGQYLIMDEMANLSISNKNYVVLQPSTSVLKYSFIQQLNQVVDGLCSLEVPGITNPILTTQTGSTTKLPSFNPLSLRDILDEDLLKLGYNIIILVCSEIDALVGNWNQYMRVASLDDAELGRIEGDNITEWLLLYDEVEKQLASLNIFLSSASANDSGIFMWYCSVCVKASGVDAELEKKLQQVGAFIESKASLIHQNNLEKVNKELLEKKNEYDSSLNKLMNSSFYANHRSPPFSYNATLVKLNGDENILAVVDYLISLANTCNYIETARSKLNELREAEKKCNVPSQSSQNSKRLRLTEVEGLVKTFEQSLSEGTKWKNGNTGLLIEEMKKVRKTMDEKVSQSINQWSKHQFSKDITNPNVACKQLNDIIDAAEELLKKLGGMNISLGTLSLPPVDVSAVERVKKDVEDERGRWLELSTAYNRLNNVRRVTLRDCDIRQTLQQLNEVLNEVKALPQTIHLFPAYGSFVELIRRHIDGCLLLDEIKGETMKVRHWEELGGRFNINFFNEIEPSDGDTPEKDSPKAVIPTEELKSPMDKHLASTSQSPLGIIQAHSIGFIMDSCIWNKLVPNSISVTKDVLLTAQGEFAIDTFLTQLKEKYQQLNFQTVEFGDGSKCPIIKNWDLLFQHLSEDLSQLEGMRWSPYFSAFVTDATTWTERLGRLQSTLDRWSLVQTKWVELEGVFAVVRGAEFSSQSQILTYAEEFRKAEKEFLNISRQYLRRSPAYLSSLEQNQQLPSVLERLIKTLENVQHGLSQYLEQQRNLFARFFFLGDEDMVDMIGAAQDATKTQRHLRKLFAGIHYLIIEIPEDGKTVPSTKSPQKPPIQIVKGFGSKEDETVLFKAPFSIEGGKGVHTWLKKVDDEMRITLGDLFIVTFAKLNTIGGSFPVPQSSKGHTPQSFTVVQSTKNNIKNWTQDCPDMLVLLALHGRWTNLVEEKLLSRSSSHNLLGSVEYELSYFLFYFTSLLRLAGLPFLLHKKFKHIITEIVYLRDETRSLIQNKCVSVEDHHWLSSMRTYVEQTGASSQLSKLLISIGDSIHTHGMEYQGCPDRLVHTSLTSVCFSVLAQALKHRMGGSPFGLCCVFFFGSALCYFFFEVFFLVLIYF